MDPRHALGARAEDVAAGWLEQQGWTVLARRWRSPRGELDLICTDREAVLVGVEVKVRSTARSGSGPDSVDPRRVLRLRAALAAYAGSSRVPRAGVRLDLVSLSPHGGRWRIVRLPGIDAW